MGLIELLVSVAFAIPLGVGISLTLGGNTQGEFLWAKICYIAAALAIAFAYFYWLYQNQLSLLLRAFVGCIVGTFVMWGVPELIRWSSGRQGSIVSIKASSDRFVEANHSKPKSLSELYKTDFSNTAKLSGDNTFTKVSKVDSSKTQITFRSTIYMDFAARAKFYGFYVPHSTFAYECIEALATEYAPLVDNIGKSVYSTSKDPGDSDSTASTSLTFSGRIYLYHDDDLSLVEKGKLSEIYKLKNLDIQFRGSDYATTRWLQEQASLKK